MGVNGNHPSAVDAAPTPCTPGARSNLESAPSCPRSRAPHARVTALCQSRARRGDAFLSDVSGREPQASLAVAAARGTGDAPTPRHIEWLLAPAIRAGPPARHRHLVLGEAPGECVHTVKEKRLDQHEVRDR